jgi:hypothetical protein
MVTAAGASHESLHIMFAKLVNMLHALVYLLDVVNRHAGMRLTPTGVHKVRNCPAVSFSLTPLLSVASGIDVRLHVL